MLLHGAESFLRSQLRNFWHFMEPKDSLPCSEQPTSCPYCVPDESSYCTPILFMWALFQYFLLSKACGVFPLDFPTRMLFFSPMCAIWPSQLTRSLFDQPNNICWGTQIMKFLIMQSSPVPCSFFSARLKYLQHPVLKHPQYKFVPQCKIWSFTPTYSSRQNCSSVCFIFIFLDSKWEDTTFWTKW
jgi:hypothetical protein